MEFLLNLDLFLFKLINLNGEVSFDKTMILLSNKYVFIPLYIYILFILYKKFKNNFLWILLSIVFSIILIRSITCIKSLLVDSFCSLDDI